MSVKTARIRRRFYASLHDMEYSLFFIGIVLIMFILITNTPQINSNTQTKEAGHSAQLKVIKNTPTPTPTDEQMIKALPYGSLVWKTYGHESTYGKNDSCRAKGLFNGFGFGQNNFGYYCYSSLREVAVNVSNWFAKYVYMGTKSELCFYNTGKVMNDCEYAEYTLSL